MLPGNLFGRYTRYKEDTDTFATWLFNQAQSCGYSQDERSQGSTRVQQAAPSTRLKGKARKEARSSEATKPGTDTVEIPTQEHTLATREIVTQANLVASFTKPPVKVPFAIQGVLRRAIAGRMRCSTWFQSIAHHTTDKNLEASNSAHEFFIRTLEQAFKILEPRFERLKPPSTSTGSNIDFINRFDGLQIEDIEDHELDFAAEEAARSIPSKKHMKNSGASTVDTGKLDFVISKDLQFLVYCFYEDLHAMRAFIQQTWKDVSQGRLSNLTASITTDVALELVRKQEQDILKLYPATIQQQSYIGLTSAIRQITPFDWNFFSHPSTEDLDVALDLQRQGHTVKACESAADEFTFHDIFLSLQKAVGSDGPLSLPSMEYIYLRHAPQFSPSNERWASEDETLTKLVLEMRYKAGLDRAPQLFEAACAAAGVKKPSNLCEHAFDIEDEVTKGLQSVKDKGVLISQIFNARTILDILDILDKDSGEPYGKLRQVGANAVAVLRVDEILDNSTFVDDDDSGPNHWDNIGRVYQELSIKWGANVAGLEAMDLNAHINMMIKNNYFANDKHKVLMLYPVTPSRLGTPEQVALMCIPSSDPEFYLNHQPVYCGLETLKVLIAMNKAGLSLTNNFGSTAAVAHLYNALQQNNMLKGRWVAMDQFIDANITALFKGALPTTSKQAMRRLLLCLGVSAPLFARNRRSAKPLEDCLNSKQVRKGWNMMFAAPELSTNLRKYLAREISGEQLLCLINKSQSKGISKCRKREPSHLEMLTLLKTCVQETIPVLEVDVVTLTRRCNQLLDSIRARLKEINEFDLVLKIPILKCPANKKVLNIGTALQLVLDASDLGGDLFTTAGEVLQSFLPEANSIISVDPFELAWAGSELIEKEKNKATKV